MPQQIIIKTDTFEFAAELNDSPTAKLITDALPIKAPGNRWGGEIYFSIEVSAALEPDSRDTLSPGELAFWPPGSAFCIFFGPTPASSGDEPRAASAVNIVGNITSDLADLWDVPDGAEITIEKAD